jgi:hypothetical protein
MREILFKAKRLDNGEWVDGFSCCIGPVGQEKHYIIPMYASAFYGIEVDPSTVCEYTSLTDKNGKKVFVGDIVKCSRGCTHEVVWVQEHGGTFIGGMPAVYLSGLNPGYAWTGAEEIIGNIHDGEGGRHEGGRQ